LRASRKGFVTGRFLAYECPVFDRRRVSSFHPASTQDKTVIAEIGDEDLIPGGI